MGVRFHCSPMFRIISIEGNVELSLNIMLGLEETNTKYIYIFLQYKSYYIINLESYLLQII